MNPVSLFKMTLNTYISIYKQTLFNLFIYCKIAFNQ